VILENFGYLQLNTVWRLTGLYRWAAQTESSWGAMKRKGWQAATPEQPPAPPSGPSAGSP
jgi:hypothetical protein